MGALEKMLADKAAQIHQGGLEKIRAKSVTAFPGYGEDLKFRFGAYLKFSTNGTVVPEIRRNILLPIEAWAQEQGVGILVAGRDFPIHNTLNEIKAPVSPERLAETLANFVRCKGSPRQNLIRELLVGDTLTFDKLALDGHTVLYTCTKSVPPEYFRAREEFLGIALDNNLPATPFPSLIHSSLCRFTKVPEETNFDELVSIVDTITKHAPPYGHYLQVSEIYFGTAWDFFHPELTPLI